MKPIAIVPLACVALQSSVAMASYTGLSVTHFDTIAVLDPESGGRLAVTVHRVWANFTNPDDAMPAWGGGGSFGPAVIYNVNSTGAGSGFGFMNHVYARLLPPNTSVLVSTSASSLTVGVTLQHKCLVGVEQIASDSSATPSM